MEWIGLGDDCSKLFFAKSKQRKLATYIYSLKDDIGTTIEGFDAVGQVMVKLYISLMGTNTHHRAPLAWELSIQGICSLRINKLLFANPSLIRRLNQPSFLFQTINLPVQTAIAVVSSNILGARQAPWYVKLLKNSFEQVTCPGI